MTRLKRSFVPMPADKISGMLGLCRRAGRLVLGFDITAEAVAKKTACLVLTAKDASPRTVREITKTAQEAGLPVRTLPLTMDEIGYAVAKRAGVLAVCDSGFANRIDELLSQRESGAAESAHRTETARIQEGNA